jgi:uncharacterized protein (DUF433 family)
MKMTVPGHGISIIVPGFNCLNMNPVSRIILDPSILVGKPVIRGTRIAVDLVLELLASGWSEAMILDEYPGLEHEDILACIRYAQEIVQSERVFSTSNQEKIAG